MQTSKLFYKRIEIKHVPSRVKVNADADVYHSKEIKLIRLGKNTHDFRFDSIAEVAEIIMRCLRCWNEITDKHAVVTRSCNHVFCQKCGDDSFKKELSCPLCDTVLPKDGVTTITLKPDTADLKKVSAKVFGFEPHEMCEVLQIGLQFWANQRQNESLKKAQEVRAWKKRVEESEAQVRKLSTALDEERMKKQSLIEEKEYLERLVAELETRYAEKARSMRKLNELYNELRQVHRRLEVDLRGVRESDERDPDIIDGSEIEMRTVKTTPGSHGEKGCLVRKEDRIIGCETLSEKKSHVERAVPFVSRNVHQSAGLKEHIRSRQESSGQREDIFQLAKYTSHSSLGVSSREKGGPHDRKRERRHSREETKENESTHRLTRRPSGQDH